MMMYFQYAMIEEEDGGVDEAKTAYLITASQDVLEGGVCVTEPRI